MTRIVDNSPIGVEPLSKEERRELKEEREQEEYLAMCETVRREFAPGYAPFKVDDTVVHLEAMRRLREKYESACGK